MRITNIKKIGGIFIVSFAPNIIERIFGFKEKTKRYKHTGGFYALNEKRVVICENGEKLKATDKIVEALENFERRF